MTTNQSSFTEEYTTSPNISTIRRLGYPTFCLVTVFLFFKPLADLYRLARSSDTYSQILVAPFLALFFLWYHRSSIRNGDKLSFIPGIIIIGCGALSLAASFFIDKNIYPVLRMDFITLAFILIFAGGTFTMFGMRLFFSARFAWLLLLLMIPLPGKILDKTITFFQYGSAEVVDPLFQITGQTFIRDGLTFHLPSITIFIARECSGIRSSTALFITAILAGHIFLKTFPGKTVLVFFVIPLTLLKNGLRITTLSILADKVDTRWLTNSHLHSDGGIVFFGIILLILFAILFAIQRAETILIEKNLPAVKGPDNTRHTATHGSPTVNKQDISDS